MQENSTANKSLRDLATKAYNEELKKYLLDLYEKFNLWKNGEFTSILLANFIHRFHNGISKKLFRIYTNLDASLLVARAIALGILSYEDVDKEIIKELSEKIEFYKNQKNELIEDDLDYEY